MAQPSAVELGVGDLADAVRRERNPVHRHARLPAPGCALEPAGRAAAEQEAVLPGVALQRDRERRQLARQALLRRPRERARDADVLEATALVEEPEQERRHRRRLRRSPHAGHDAVGRALVLDLEHRPPAVLVRPVARLRDDAVQAAAAEALQPAGGDVAVAGRRRDEQRRRRVAEQFDEPRAALAKRARAKVLPAHCQQVEGDEQRGRPLRELAHAPVRRMQPRHERREVEPPLREDEQLAVERKPRGLLERGERGGDLREVPRERPPVAAAQVDIVALAVGEAAKAVPLRLVQDVARRQLADEPREHRLVADVGCGAPVRGLRPARRRRGGRLPP